MSRSTGHVPPTDGRSDLIIGKLPSRAWHLPRVPPLPSPPPPPGRPASPAVSPVSPAGDGDGDGACYSSDASATGSASSLQASSRKSAITSLGAGKQAVAPRQVCCGPRRRGRCSLAGSRCVCHSRFFSAQAVIAVRVSRVVCFSLDDWAAAPPLSRVRAAFL